MCITNVKIINQTISSISIEWENEKKCDVYKVINILKNECIETVYWGAQTKCLISSLTENVCYKFQIFALCFENDQYLNVASSEIIRANTLPNIPSTTSIIRAIRKSHDYVLKRYLKAKPMLINVPSPNGMTPLANAVILGNLDAAEILLSFGANVNLGCSINGRTPLQLACFYGHIQISKLLLEYKADKLIKDKVGMNFAHYAIDGGHINAIEFALKIVENLEDTDNSGWTILLRAVVLQSSPDVIQLLLKYKCNPYAIDKNGLNAIELAKVTNQLKLIEIFEQCKK